MEGSHFKPPPAGRDHLLKTKWARVCRQNGHRGWSQCVHCTAVLESSGCHPWQNSLLAPHKQGCYRKQRCQKVLVLKTCVWRHSGRFGYKEALPTTIFIGSLFTRSFGANGQGFIVQIHASFFDLHFVARHSHDTFDIVHLRVKRRYGKQRHPRAEAFAS